MAKDLGHSKENIVKENFDVKRKCSDCGTEYLAKETHYKNGDVVFSPMRCDKCQTSHLVAVRVQKVIDGIKGLSNLKNRVNSHFGDMGKQAITDEITMELKNLLDAYQGTTTKTVSKFDLRQIVKS